MKRVLGGSAAICLVGLASCTHFVVVYHGPAQHGEAEACVPADFYATSGDASPARQIDQQSSPDLENLEAVTSRIIQANGLSGGVGLREGDTLRAGSPAMVRSNGTEAEIVVDPTAVQRIPINSWAFILGHELAHHTQGLGGSFQEELRADAVGARYAAQAGYDPVTYLQWVIHTQGAGSPRIEVVGRELGIPPQLLWR